MQVTTYEHVFEGITARHSAGDFDVPHVTLDKQAKCGRLKVVEEFTLATGQRKSRPADGEYGIPTTGYGKPHDRAILLKYKAAFAICAKRLAYAELDGCRKGILIFNRATGYQLPERFAQPSDLGVDHLA